MMQKQYSYSPTHGQQKFTLVQPVRFALPAGTEVYLYWGQTYGIPYDDQARTGEMHFAVTMVQGEAPFFSVPASFLE
jgi:hypothetical protein